MNNQRFAFIAAGVALVAAVIWFTQSPQESVTPVAANQPGAEPQRRIGPTGQVVDPSDELESARAEIVRLEAELIATESSAAEEQNDFTNNSTSPDGYTGRARAFAGFAREKFEGEAVDPAWAQTAESEIFDAIHSRISTSAIAINLVDVRCKTDACRVRLSFSQSPIEPSELSRATYPAIKLSHQVAREVSSVAYSGLIQVRNNFPGEPTMAELFLFRTGSDGIFSGVETPLGESLHCAQPSCYPALDDEAVE